MKLLVPHPRPKIRFRKRPKTSRKRTRSPEEEPMADLTVEPTADSMDDVDDGEFSMRKL